MLFQVICRDSNGGGRQRARLLGRLFTQCCLFHAFGGADRALSETRAKAPSASQFCLISETKRSCGTEQSQPRSTTSKNEASCQDQMPLGSFMHVLDACFCPRLSSTSAQDGNCSVPPDGGPLPCADLHTSLQHRLVVCRRQALQGVLQVQAQAGCQHALLEGQVGTQGGQQLAEGGAEHARMRRRRHCVLLGRRRCTAQHAFRVSMSAGLGARMVLREGSSSLKAGPSTLIFGDGATACCWGDGAAQHSTRSGRRTCKSAGLKLLEGQVCAEGWQLAEGWAEHAGMCRWRHCMLLGRRRCTAQHKIRFSSAALRPHLR